MPIECLKCGQENSVIEPSCVKCGDRLDNLPIIQELAHMDIKLGKIKDGIKRLKEVAGVYITDGNFEEVDKIVKYLLTLNPDDVEIHILIGDMYLKRGELDQAEKSYREVLKKEISNIIVLNKLGETLAKKGDENSAVIAYKKVMKMDPNNPAPYEYLVKLALDKGNKKEAINIYNKLAELYKQSGNESKSVEYTNSALELSGKKPILPAPLPQKDKMSGDDDTPPQEETEVIGLHLPDIQLSFGDEEDPFAPPSSTYILPPAQQKKEEAPPPDEVKNEEKPKHRIYSKSDIYLHILYEHDDYNKRLLALSNLTPMDGEHAVNGFVYALKDEHRSIRTQAALALGTAGDKRALDVLIETLEKDTDESVRQNSASILGLLNDATAIDPLIKALKDKDISVRQSAVMSLGRFNDSKIVDPLIEYLDTDDKAMWGKIVPIITAITSDKKIIKPFIKVFEKTNDIDLRLSIMSILKEFKEPLLYDLLIRSLKDEERSIKLNAIKTLGDFSDKKAIKHLCEFLTDKDNELNKAADEALSKLGYKKTPLARLKAILFKKY